MDSITAEEKLNIYKMVYSNLKHLKANFWVAQTEDEDEHSIVLDADSGDEYLVDGIGIANSKFSKDLIVMTCVGDKNTYKDGIAVNEIIYKDDRIASIENDIAVNIGKSYVIDIDTDNIIVILFTEECKIAILYNTNTKCADTIINDVDISFSKNNNNWVIIMQNEDSTISKEIIVNEHIVNRIFTIDDEAVIDDDCDDFEIEYPFSDSEDEFEDNYNGYNESYLDYN